MKKAQRSTFRLNPIAASVIFAMASQLSTTLVYANAGWGDNTDINGQNFRVQTFYANSPSGLHPAYDGLTGAALLDASGNPVMGDSGTALRKFVDPLPGIGSGGIPLVITEKWYNPLTQTQTADDYYEIGIVDYSQKLHSDLANPTHLRGYVQIETPAIAAGLTDRLGNKSEHIEATYPDGTKIKDNLGNPVYWVHQPHYLGPAIQATRGTAVRLKYTNYLSYGTVGSATNPPVGKALGGAIGLPVDEYIPGGGPTIDAAGNATKLTQNRANIHWHGGDTPWISDGTPHQWVAPAGETAAYAGGIGKGASTQNVPDMPDPGPGSSTLYFPNNISGRLMFYHDHTSGMTKLNVYNGIAAPYIIADPVEQTLAGTAKNPVAGITQGVIPDTLQGMGIPLVIQDKTFVPKDIAQEDGRWDTSHWGQEGDLWFPHVYEPNQDPNSIDGTNPVGRWDWGPWFWPVFPSQYSLPTGKYGDVSATPEAFMDTPLVNGVAYPSMEVEPKAYRFRVLNAANDRAWNLGFYQAVDANGALCNPVNATPLAEASGVACTEVKMVPAQPTAGFPATWPTDGRAGGVPDPATAGPDILQIGNEGGLLPNLATWKSQPVSYEQNVRSITVYNVLDHELLIMPAERADIVVDFSKYAGQTLILYNDSPAPMPGLDPRIDYFTGDGDNSGAGGAYNTERGYGPNTRTVMQIKVRANPPAAAFDVAKLAAALPAAYAASQPRPNIPEAVYNAAFGTTDADNYAHIYTGSNAQPTFQWTPNGVQTIMSVNMVGGGHGYTSAPTVNFIGGGGSGAMATATIDPVMGTVTGITMLNPGLGYTSKPMVTLTGGGGSGATVMVNTTSTRTLPIINKAIQELFEPVYGRMNATLAVELPYSTALIATTVPLSYIDTPVDYYDGIKDGETQIWKITHNGVDSHPVHFHLVNVQVLNRVGWDGTIKPPAQNEVGWKETLRMNPLEDVIVAVHATHPVAPFGLPKSTRLLDPTQAAGSQLGFTQIDPMTGQAPAVPYSNIMTDFDNEYVWHCHILGHEENDFMRPFIFHPNVLVPDASVLSLSGTTLSWTDRTPLGGDDSNGVPTAGTNALYQTPTSSPKNEIGYLVQQSTDNGVSYTTIKTLPANVTSWTDAGLSAANTYQVVAYNVAGGAPSNSVGHATAATAANLTGTYARMVPAPVPGSLANTVVTLNWTAFSMPNAGYNVYRNGVLLKTAPTTTGVNYVDLPVNEGATYAYKVVAVRKVVTVVKTPIRNRAGVITGYTSKNVTSYPEINPAATVSVMVPNSVPQAPSALNVKILSTNPEAFLNWTDNAYNELGYVVQRQIFGGGANGDCTTSTGLWTTLDTTAANVGSYVDSATAYGVAYCYRVSATNAAGSSSWLMTPFDVTPNGLTSAAVVMAAPTGLTQTLDANGNTVLSWTAVAGATGYVVTVNGVAQPVVTGTTLTLTGISGGTVTVAAVGSTLTSSVFNGAAYDPVNFMAVPGSVSGTVTLTWANNPLNVSNVTQLVLTWQGVAHTFPATATGATITGLVPGNSYRFGIQAIGSVGNSVGLSAVSTSAP